VKTHKAASAGRIRKEYDTEEVSINRDEVRDSCLSAEHAPSRLRTNRPRRVHISGCGDSVPPRALALTRCDARARSAVSRRARQMLKTIIGGSRSHIQKKREEMSCPKKMRHFRKGERRECCASRARGRWLSETKGADASRLVPIEPNSRAKGVLAGPGQAVEDSLKPGH
jgi:hypothetical protein